MLRRWRRLDQPGLEVFRLTRSGNDWIAHSQITFGGTPSYAARYVWTLDDEWRTQTLRLDVMGETTDRSLMIERVGPTAWRVDGVAHAYLDCCDEIDVSATPFCNALAIRHFGDSDGEWSALYVAVPDLVLTPSRQRYERRGERTWRYIDLGVAKGFEADLEIDDDGLVRRYSNLFESLT
jgi:hypothetical protein